MRFSLRIPFSIGAPILAVVLLLLTAANPASIARSADLMGRSAVRARLTTESPRGRGMAILAMTAHGRDARATASSAMLAASQNPPAASPASTAEEAWSEAAGALAGKILDHMASGNALALTVKNISSLGDDDVVQVRRALRAQLRSRGGRLAASKLANADVQVTLSENTQGYLWIAEIRDLASPISPGDDAANPVVMVTAARRNLDDHQPTTEPLSIRKMRFYQQSDPMLDVALFDNPPAGTASSPVPASVAARILVLGLESISLYEQAATPETDSKSVGQWRPMQSAPVPRLRPWPRDARGRVIVLPDSRFDVYLPGTKCSGTREPVLTLECHESDEPWPLAGGERESIAAISDPWGEPAAYFTPDRNFFDGRIKLDDGREVKLLPFLSLVIMPAKSAARAGLPALSGRVSPGAMAGLTPTATGAPGWVLSGLDGRAQLLSGHAEPVVDVGGWGSQIVGVQSGCGNGWQVLASQAGDLNEPDAVQAYEFVNRKPVPVSGPAMFDGPITELRPQANGSGAIAIARNLRTEAYEAYRLSVSCGQ